MYLCSVFTVFLTSLVSIWQEHWAKIDLGIVPDPQGVASQDIYYFRVFPFLRVVEAPSGHWPEEWFSTGEARGHSGTSFPAPSSDNTSPHQQHFQHTHTHTHTHTELQISWWRIKVQKAEHMVKDKCHQSLHEAGQAVMFFIHSRTESSLYSMLRIAKKLYTHQIGAFPFLLLSATKISADTQQMLCAHLLPLANLTLCFYLKVHYRIFSGMITRQKPWIHPILNLRATCHIFQCLISFLI